MNDVIGFGLLALMGVVFIVWVITIMRILYGLKKIADVRRKEENAGLLRSQGITNEIFLEFLKKPEHRPNKRRAMMLTALLFATIFLQILLVPILGPGV